VLLGGASEILATRRRLVTIYLLGQSFFRIPSEAFSQAMKRKASPTESPGKKVRNAPVGVGLGSDC